MSRSLRLFAVFALVAMLGGLTMPGVLVSALLLAAPGQSSPLRQPQRLLEAAAGWRALMPLIHAQGPALRADLETAARAFAAAGGDPL